MLIRFYHEHPMSIPTYSTARWAKEDAERTLVEQLGGVVAGERKWEAEGVSIIDSLGMGAVGDGRLLGGGGVGSML